MFKRRSRIRVIWSEPDPILFLRADSDPGLMVGAGSSFVCFKGRIRIQVSWSEPSPILFLRADSDPGRIVGAGSNFVCS